MSNNNVPLVLRPAPPDESIQPLIAGRWSSRSIDSSRTVEPEILARLFEAARWAPSAFNNQPWRFLSFGPEDSQALESARKALMPGNAWALKAPRLLYSVARSNRLNSSKPNSFAPYEAGMAVAMMAIQAAQEGLLFHQMAGFKATVVRETFQVPDNFNIIAAIAVAWPGDMSPLSQELQNMEKEPRGRRPINEIVFQNGAVPQE